MAIRDLDAADVQTEKGWFYRIREMGSPSDKALGFRWLATDPQRRAVGP